MNTLFLEGVRCFREEQEIPIRPVTLLVGENSTGKSTVLAMVRAAWDVAFRRTEPNFNEEPFNLGGFNTIAHYHGGQAKRVHQFKIQSLTKVKRGNRADMQLKVSGTFVELAGQPALFDWQARLDDLSLKAILDTERPIVSAMMGGETIFEESIPTVPGGGQVPFHIVAFTFEQALFNWRAKAKEQRGGRVDQVLLQVLEMFRGSIEARPIPSAPIRSKAERTYDPGRNSPEPEGSHVPMTLATLHATNRGEFEKLAHEIAEYGSNAGLFAKLDVKRLGRKAGDPFQVVVTVDRHPFNLTDVGYGVSQILPILYDTLAAPEGQTFLLQQPEVHLHPRAQAALGSMIVAQAASRQQTFVVETHSDYLVDRVRMDIREKRGAKPLAPEDVVILYFERKDGRATVHAIDIDAQGNLVNVPDGYRSFFLNEERRLLGLA